MLSLLLFLPAWLLGGSSVTTMLMWVLRSFSLSSYLSESFFFLLNLGKSLHSFLKV